jgi:hypothetical protein
MAMVSTRGLMAVFTAAAGRRVNSTESVSTT